MDTKDVAGICVALAVACSGNPVAATCLVSPVKDQNPNDGVRTGIAQPAPNDLWVSGTIVHKDASTYPYIERFDPFAGWSRSIFSTLRQSAFNSIAAFNSGEAI